MIPHIAQRGHSFKGAGMYYLHDKCADTSERVAWTVTRNLPTQDAEIALKCMAYTDIEAKRQREESSQAGRKQTAGNVFSYSLSWHPDQQPDSTEMRRSAEISLARLGLWDHQAVLVAHSDTRHAHVHVVVNLVHPDTGKVADLSYSKRKLQAWASEYEHADGMIYCEERERNAQRRENGEITKYQDERLPAAPSITQLYQQSDSGASFVAALAEQGYALAHGDRGRLVIVDAEGVVQNLVRQIDGAKKRDIEAKLGEVLESLPTLAEAQARLQAREVEEEAPAPAMDASAPPQGVELVEMERPQQKITLKRVEQVHVACVVQLSREDTASDDNGDAAARGLSESEQNARLPSTGRFGQVREVHHGEVSVVAPSLHQQRMQQHCDRHERAENPPSVSFSFPAWGQVLAGAIGMVHLAGYTAQYDDTLPSRFINHMQRIYTHVKQLVHGLQELPVQAWERVTHQRRGAYHAWARQIHAADRALERESQHNIINDKQRESHER